jgi:PHD/YefM family antitoxin component YafN of YafNO toxin-antitoxin module
MKSFTAIDARRRFGWLLKTVRRAPVTIRKNGHIAAIILTKQFKHPQSMFLFLNIDKKPLYILGANGCLHRFIPY